MIVIDEICPFCSREIKKRAVEEGSYSFVTLSDPRLAPGHLLIIPSRHIRILSDLRNEEVVEIFKFLSKYQKKILDMLSKGVEIRQNYKPYFKNSRTHVNHLHFHLVPREETDEIAKKLDTKRKSLYKELQLDEAERILGILTN
ncbi:MAG: hypothetical protein A2172_00525 [Candidatus Woykebacteria bacterium RBG_13_40_15]|uniref:HIT domain-containing protein n=1 Tax=Candidatus Woykebacteria bacterium RBG_13_40_15 TaxID=1802593 RepID=A0A1G1W9J7_9BACT|nr:MAG: hypothetical protein A2172_00525 [Candidatus Woykebacteria bacterium RBG_13_40_15]